MEHNKDKYDIDTFFFQELKTKSKNAQYNRANIERAYNATKNGMSVYRAAKDYGVPESTLRDRTRGNVVFWMPL